MKEAILYILANKKQGTLYVGVTSNLLQRIAQHKNGTFEGFTSKYDCKMLVFYHSFPSILDAIIEEKRLKKTSRARKIQLIESMNPEWKDLSEYFHR